MPRLKRQSPRAKRIKSALAHRGITQAELAREWGVHVNTVANAINHGVNEPTLIKILDRLDLPRNLAA
jgi:lambda repressor-like predicted transcriptional regulator